MNENNPQNLFSLLNLIFLIFKVKLSFFTDSQKQLLSLIN